MAMNVDNDETVGVRFRFLNWEHKGASMSDTDSKRSHSQASKVASGKLETFVLTTVKKIKTARERRESKMVKTGCLQLRGEDELRR